MRKLALRAEEVLKSPEMDGLVYVQGTNTIEETAYFLNLTVNSDKPIVITGAQRPFNALSSDAQMNLLDAVRLASAPASRGKGALVAFNGEINAARIRHGGRGQLEPAEGGAALEPCVDQDLECGRDPANVRRVLSGASPGLMSGP